MPAAKVVKKKPAPKKVKKDKKLTRPSVSLSLRPKTTAPRAKPKAKKVAKKKPAHKGGCGCSAKSIQDGGFIDVNGLAKLSIPFGLLLAKQSLEQVMKKNKDHKSHHHSHKPAHKVRKPKYVIETRGKVVVAPKSSNRPKIINRRKFVV